MKHAYLIMVHKNSYVLGKLLELLDYHLNDIFIHIDAKCTDFDKEKYMGIIRNAQIFFCENRITVNWGGYSQVLAEMVLMKCALDHGQYAYYHLLSGQDLPLKTQTAIHEICDRTPERLYLDCRMNLDKGTDFGKKVYQRASVIHYLQENRTRFKNTLLKNMVIFADRCLIGIQVYLLKRDFVKAKKIPLVFGSNWFSLPEKVIKYIVEHESKIEMYFSRASFCDELFVQTILADSGYKFDISGNMRYIDFGRAAGNGHPYIWQINDFNELINSEAFFARKFDENIDMEIIDKISYYLKRGCFNG